MLENRTSQLRLLNEELGHLRGLVKEGYAPRNRQLELGMVFKTPVKPEWRERGTTGTMAS
jgi:hypothetical protein